MATRRMRFAAMVAGVLVLALVAGACSSDDGGDTEGDGSATPAGSTSDLSITASDFQFSPNELTLPSGESSITVTNEGAVEHSFTLDDDSVSEDIEPGDSVTVTVDLTADAGFHCKYHPDQMTGTLSVA
jgi:plastocyanin